MSHVYSLEGLAPLVFRSGKPFGAQAGADGAAFPPPSSLAGLLRTLHADQTAAPFSDALRELAVAGPLLGWRSAEGILPLLPKPADAIYLKTEQGEIRVMRLAPARLPVSCGTDLPSGLLPVVMQDRLEGKPMPGAQYWPLEGLLRWRQGENLAFDYLKTHGLQELTAVARTHVAIDRDTKAARDGQLFQTGGIDLAPHRLAVAGRPEGGWAERDLVFLARSEISLSPTLATFGGERRLSRLQPAAPSVWPQPPGTLEAGIRAAGGLSLTLVTPALLATGFRPGWLDEHLEGEHPACPGLRLRLRAAAVERWLPVSGWDLASHKPRAMRKAVAAGAVYWFELLNEPPADFLAALWLTPLSDKPQDRCDGFGLALPAPWTPAT